MAGRRSHGNLQLAVNVLLQLEENVGEGGLFSLKVGGQLKEWFQESIGGSCYFSPGV